MDESIQHGISLACIDLLHKNAIANQPAGHITGDTASALSSQKDSASTEPKTKKDAIAWLLTVADKPNITFDQVIDALWIIYKRSRPSSQTRQWIVQLLLDLARQEDITPLDAIRAAGTLCALDLQDPQKLQEAVQILLALATRRDIYFGDTVEAAHTLYTQNPKGSQARELGAQMLLTQARWPDITVEQAQEAALALAYARVRGALPKDWNQAIQVLIELAQRPNLSFEDAMILDNQRGVVHSSKAVVRQQLAARKQMWETITQNPDLTIEQRAEAAQALQDYTSFLEYK